MLVRRSTTSIERHNALTRDERFAHRTCVVGRHRTVHPLGKTRPTVVMTRVTKAAKRMKGKEMEIHKPEKMTAKSDHRICGLLQTDAALKRIRTTTTTAVVVSHSCAL